MPNRTVDVLIIGQGLAGTLVGYLLEKAGKTVQLIDAPQQAAASRVAAGIINPITGRRFVKSWRIGDLLPAAKALYTELETFLGATYYHEQPIIRTLFNRGDENNWLARTGEADYSAYMAETASLGSFAHCTQAAFGYGQVRQSAQVNIGRLVEAMRQYWQRKGRYTAAEFHYDQLVVRENAVHYGNWAAQQVVFCEGWRLRFNPFFQDLPLNGNKGEALIVRIPDAQFDRILKHRVFIVPFGKGEYWIGATSENEWLTEQPTAPNGAYLRDRLEEVLRIQYEVLDQRAAIRPTVKDRRPLVGQHPEYPRLWLLNGLGTKGTSLAPYCATQLVAKMLGRPHTWDPVIDFQRFYGS